MSSRKLPRELVEKVPGMVFRGAAHAVRHPVESAAYGAGLVRGAATAVRRLKSGHGVVTEDDLAGHESTEPATAPQRVGLEPGERLAAEDAEAVTPAPAHPGGPGEQFETEPQASSRDSEHGGPGDDSELDVLEDWPQDPGAEPDPGTPDVTTPAGTTGAGAGFNPDTGETDLQQPDTEPLMDPSLTKSVKSESDTMRKAADRDKSTDQID
ncbi:MAG TPA: hypothetical protein VFO98_07270 [Marmoricola sp.]|jgi:hypothetical protein|nr:hypothetical protein [Marmoricola sp.]